MTIQVDLLEAPRYGVVDCIHVAEAIRKCADDIDEFGFTTENDYL